MIGIRNVIAIVCGGGPAPGINSVISGITNEASRHGWDVIGIYDGFSRLARGEKNYLRLEPKNISHIHMTGGCILKMSRYNPTKKESDLRTCVETLTELGVTHLVTIGGDDTAYSSAAVAEYARKMGRTINVVHVPKTIDNDLPLPDGVPTFGFETARAFATTEIENLMEDARTTNNRWYFTIAMGRTAGHLALGMGFTNTIHGFENKTLDECRALGINDSMIHVDFMIGFDGLDIDARTADGRLVPIFRQGKWAF